MDIFNTKKVHDLEFENTLLKKQVSILTGELQSLKTIVKNNSNALKALNTYTSEQLNDIKGYLMSEGRKKTVNGQKISCFELFLKDKE